jgi:predicted dehydrogenase
LHLFVEKPIALSVSEADRLIEAAKKNKVRILVGHQRRFSSLVEKAREIVTGGELGKLVGVTITWALLKPGPYFGGPLSWRKEKGGGPILINLIHEIDNLRYICGEIDQVFALVSNKVRNFPVEDTPASPCDSRTEHWELFSIRLHAFLTSWEGTTEKTRCCTTISGTAITSSARRVVVVPSNEELYYSDPEGRMELSHH